MITFPFSHQNAASCRGGKLMPSNYPALDGVASDVLAVSATLVQFAREVAKSCMVFPEMRSRLSAISTGGYGSKEFI